jgi:hypothetical protein
MSTAALDKIIMSEQELFQRHLAFLQSISFRYERTLLGEQNSLKRFLYCATEKLNKSCAALIRLYPAIYEDQDIEFSMGVILRSLLMDSILTQYLRRATLTLEDSGDNQMEIVAVLQKESLKLIADGTVSIFEDFLAASTLPDDEQKRLAHNMARQFPGLFITDAKTGFPKLPDVERVSIKRMHKKGQHENQHTHRHVYELYAFYSKYDHVSHWTSIIGNIDWNERLRRLHFSILNVMFNFRDILVLGQWLEAGSLHAPRMLKELDAHMDRMAPSKSESIK